MLCSNKPLFRMVQMSDMHLDATQDREGAEGKFLATLKSLAEDPPEVLLSLGDLVHDPRSIESHCFVSEQIRHDLPHTIHLPVAGNHDLDMADPRDTDAWIRVYGRDMMTYSFFFGGVLFVIIDNSHGDAPGTPGINERNAYLRDLFERTADLPKLVATHVPLVPLRDPATLEASFAYPTWISQDPEQRLFRLLERHRDSILAVASGHLHLTGAVEDHGLWWIGTSGLLSWPHDVAHWEFFPDRVTVRMASHVGPADQVGFEPHPMRNGIHDRHGPQSRFADEAHPSFAAYLRGNEAERQLTLPLAGRRRISSEVSYVTLKDNGLPAPETRSSLEDARRVNVLNLSAEPRIACVPKPPGIEGPAWVMLEPGATSLLDEHGKNCWPAESLAEGVPIEVPPASRVTVCFLDAPPTRNGHKVETEILRRRERNEHQVP